MSFETVTIGPCTLIRGDAKAVLPSLGGGFDIVISDSPYGNNYSTGRRKGIIRPTTKITGDILSEPLLNDVAAQLEPLLNDVAAVYWFAAPDRLDMLLPIVKRHWDVVNVLAWDKGNCTAGDLECSYGKQWESIVYAVTEKAPLIGGRDRDILRFPRLSGADYVHPTQKPAELISYLIGRHAGQSVIDPFMGSGTTAVASIHEGRRFTGIEVEPRYFAEAVRRVTDAWKLERSKLRFEPAPVMKQRDLLEAAT